MTQPERTAATRQKLIEATIDCLVKFGYATTSTTLIAERAGVSRGALFYNFATKADLMLAVLDDVYETDTKLYDDNLKGITNDRDYALALTKLSWQAFSGRGGIATMRIALEGSNDPELKDRLPASLARVSDRARNRQDARAPTGAHRTRLRLAASRVHVAALRGLTMSMITGAKPEDLRDELELLNRYMQFVTDVLWARSRRRRSQGERRQMTAKSAYFGPGSGTH
ncbi:MAG TPA: TetR/AcrR family transcriptional regulator [Caulobacteraceae bacterium]